MIARNPPGTEGFQPSTRARRPRSGRLKVLIIGGYGTFGGRLAELLCGESALTLLIAGRSASKAAAFCEKLPKGAHREPVALDRDRGLAASLENMSADIVVDASGPFQAYGTDPYRVVKAALAARCHYMDLSDDPVFVRDIVQFHQAAKERELVVLSGASSFPVLSACMVRDLAEDMQQVDSIVGGIAPSPYAGVGYNVIRAIAGYAGKPIPVRREGRADFAFGLTETKNYTIGPPGCVPLTPLEFSLVNVPDLQLLADEWPEVQTIWMGAAPQPAVLHRLLRWLAGAVARGVIPSLAPLARLIFHTANTIRWGEHRGGMFVEIEGRDATGERARRSLHLVAEGQHGSYIPSMAVQAILRNWLEGRPPGAGARPASRELELADYRRLFAHRAINLGKRRDATAAGHCLHQQVMGDTWRLLPPCLKAVHKSGPYLKVSGMAAITRGRGLMARVLAWMLRFPKEASKVPVSVTFERFGSFDKWTRDFGGQVFSSTFSAGLGRFEHLLCERFGPFLFGMALVPEGNRLRLVMRRWSFLGVPLPDMLVPRGNSCEFAVNERFNFDVEITLPIFGFVIRYKGFLNPPYTAESLAPVV